MSGKRDSPITVVRGTQMLALKRIALVHAF